MKIEIFTRSMNYRLYDAAMHCLDSLPYKRHRLRATSADGYLLAMLRSKADWAINIDEDAFVTDIDALKELIEYCSNNGIVNCGMPDGGVLPIRDHNPLVTNPFFNIINLSALREKYSKEVVASYAIHKPEYETVAPIHIIRGKYSYDNFEPYCNFFIWVSQNFKTLYLDAETHPDGISTVLKNHKGVPFIIHTWYSRFYGTDNTHTQRIDSVINRYSRRTPENSIRRITDRFLNHYWYQVVKKMEDRGFYF